MKGVLGLVLSSVLLTGCGGFYLEPYPPTTTKTVTTVYEYTEYTEYEYCDDSEPYWEPALQYEQYYDYYGHYEGECGVWYLGNGIYEEWCTWEDMCGWEYVDNWYY